MEEYLYNDLTHAIIGIAYKVYNTLGYGVREQYVHRAFSSEFDAVKLSYVHEFSISLIYNGKKIGDYRLDFIVDDKVIVEIKIVPVMKQAHIKQALEYLRTTKKKLALLIFFTPQCVQIKRIILPDKSR